MTDWPSDVDAEVRAAKLLLRQWGYKVIKQERLRTLGCQKVFAYGDLQRLRSVRQYDELLEYSRQHSANQMADTLRTSGCLVETPIAVDVKRGFGGGIRFTAVVLTPNDPDPWDVF